MDVPIVADAREAVIKMREYVDTVSYTHLWQEMLLMWQEIYNMAAQEGSAVPVIKRH